MDYIQILVVNIILSIRKKESYVKMFVFVSINVHIHMCTPIIHARKHITVHTTMYHTFQDPIL